MAKKQKEQPILTLDEKEYFKKDMTAEQLRVTDHLADLANKINTNMFIGEQLQVNKEAFINLFRAIEQQKESEADEKGK
jgi:hypothetical protein|tara:strand:- start:275 stop:511 length:237 start_codon:yes stop_codon:yes gene_type:complete